MQAKAEKLAPAASICRPAQLNPPALVITSNELSSYGSLGSSFRSFTVYSVCNKQGEIGTARLAWGLPTALRGTLGLGPARRPPRHSWPGACPPPPTALLAWGVPTAHRGTLGASSHQTAAPERVHRFHANKRTAAHAYPTPPAKTHQHRVALQLRFVHAEPCGQGRRMGRQVMNPWGDCLKGGHSCASTARR